MSAYMVSKAHIDAMLTGATRYSRPYGLSWYVGHERHELRYDNLDAIGQMLVDANLRSIHARYPDCRTNPDNTPGPIARYWDVPYVHETRADFSPVELLKAIDCFEYQACEDDDWETSEAHACCAALRHILIRVLPGYESAPWGIDEDTVPAEVAKARTKYARLNRAMTNRTA